MARCWCAFLARQKKRPLVMIASLFMACFCACFCSWWFFSPIRLCASCLLRWKDKDSIPCCNIPHWQPIRLFCTAAMWDYPPLPHWRLLICAIPMTPIICYPSCAPWHFWHGHSSPSVFFWALGGLITNWDGAAFGFGILWKTPPSFRGAPPPLSSIALPLGMSVTADG